MEGCAGHTGVKSSLFPQCFHLNETLAEMIENSFEVRR